MQRASRLSPRELVAAATAYGALLRASGVPSGPYYPREAERAYDALVKRLGASRIGGAWSITRDLHAG